MITQTEDIIKFDRTKSEIGAIFAQQQTQFNSKYLQNFRAVNSSSDLIRIKSKSQLSEFKMPESLTTITPKTCYPYLNQVPTCDPFAKMLMDKAYASNLSRRDQQVVLNELLRKPSFIHEVNLTPSKLPELIERNPLISYEILLKIVHRIDDTAFYAVILDMPLSLHSMEVIHRLCTTTLLPLDVVKLYIANSLSKCEKIGVKSLQFRFVRLICVFLQAIVRNKIYAIEDMYFEILAFCVNFYQIKESANLWCLIKRLKATKMNDKNKLKLLLSTSSHSLSSTVSADTHSTSTSRGRGASDKRVASKRKVQRSKSQKATKVKTKK